MVQTLFIYTDNIKKPQYTNRSCDGGDKSPPPAEGQADGDGVPGADRQRVRGGPDRAAGETRDVRGRQEGGEGGERERRHEGNTGVHRRTGIMN